MSWYVLSRTGVLRRSVSDLRAGGAALAGEGAFRPARYLAANSADVHGIHSSLIKQGIETIHSGPFERDEAESVAALMNDALAVLES